MKNNVIEKLREFFNIGAAGAANALGKIIKKRVLMEVPNVCFLSVDKIVEQIGVPDKLVTAVHFDIKGGFNSGILLIFDHQAILNLASLTFKDFDEDIRSEKTVSFIKEISNIMTSYFLNNFAKFIGKPLIPSVPAYAFDMLGAILEELVFSYNIIGSDIFYLETVIFNKEEKIFFDFLLIPENGSLARLLSGSDE